ncbi:MAG: phenylacetate--CoA ligase family protein [Deltaproteobacteria bacterium]|nr:phenylacetate--CoA ligase family protein [Deltaproteobacteria bacterium]
MSIDFRLRDFAHPFSIWRLHRALERNQWLSPREVAVYRDERLRAIVRHAYRNVPFYRQRFDEAGVDPKDIRGAADLDRLPLLSKETVRRAGESIHARGASRYHPIEHRTSGTTGEPLLFLLDRFANSLEFAYYWRHWSWAGFELGDRFAELGTTHFLKRPELIDSPAHWQPHLRRLMLNGVQLSARRAADMAAAMRRHRPQFIKGMASTLFFLARCFDEAGAYAPPLRAAFSTGEMLSQSFRETIESVFSCPVLDSYGHMERTVAIAQCPQGGYHVNSDYGLLEVVDQQRSPTSETRVGKAVGTSLHNLAMPLLRYEVGDRIELLPEDQTCSCGRGLPLVKAIQGREEDVVVTPDGRYLTAIFILPEFVDGIGFAQFVQDQRDSLVINVVPIAGWSDEQRRKLTGYASRLLGGSMKLAVRTVEASEIEVDPSGKRRVVISQIAD